MNLWRQLKRFYKYAWPSIFPRRYYFLGAMGGFWLGLLIADTLVPLWYKKIINYLSESPNNAITPELLWLIVGQVIFYVVYSVCFRISDYSQYQHEGKTLKDLTDRSFDQLTEHSYQFFSDNFSGALVAKTKRLVTAFETAYSEITYGLGPAILSMTATAIVFFSQNYYLGLFFVLWLVIYFIAITLFIIYRNRFDLKVAEADSKVTAQLSDVITNILTVKLFSGKNQEAKDFKEVTGAELEARLKTDWLYVIQFGVMSLIFTILEVGGMLLAIVFWSEGKLSIGTVVLVQLLLANLFTGLWNLGRSLTRFTTAVSNASEMLDLLEKPIEVTDNKEPLKLTKGAGKISFKKINFGYTDGNLVFKQFDLDIKAGERLGLVGASGCGKSTLTKLLLRFVDVSAGEILIDDQNIKNLKQDDLRSKISYVPQDPLLFHRSLLENIKYGLPHASKKMVIEAAKKAYAHDFISKLPKGYDTLVGERGIKLSGGERQRVAIARAILKNAPILILDEATSSLDTESEKYIKEALAELIKNRTTIVIAHRLSTIQKMDRIIVLDQGKIVEDGTHDKLLGNKEIYHKFWQYQIS